MLFNKSEIMKRAWKIKKEKGISLSSALRISWNIAKNALKDMYVSFEKVNEEGHKLEVKSAILEDKHGKKIKNLSDNDIKAFNKELAKCKKTRETRRTAEKLCNDYIENILKRLKIA